jgi:hypothetical protein
LRLSSIFRAIRRAARLPRELEKQLINQGRILAHLNSKEKFADLSDYEFKVFSQWGEDGIIQHLVGAMPGIPQSFVEFGVEDFTESNCRFLMMKDCWSGYIVDGSEKNCAAIRNADWHWKHDLTVRCDFIDRDNIDQLLRPSGFYPEPGILSVDIDGVDWFVLNALDTWRPWIIIVEYNGLFGSLEKVSVPYDPTFVRYQKHYTGLYWGASLGAFDELLSSRGYQLAGTNKAGSNAFFVRIDVAKGHIPKTSVAKSCRPVIFRDVKDERGNLQFLKQSARVKLIENLLLVDTVTGSNMRVADLGLA